MRESLQALNPTLALGWALHSKQNIFPGQKLCSFFTCWALQQIPPLHRDEIWEQSRKGKQRHQLAQLHPGGGCQKTPISKQKSELQVGLEAQVWRAENEESFLTTQKGVRGQKIQLTPKASMGCAVGHGECSENPNTPSRAHPLLPTQALPGNWFQLEFQLLHRPGLEPTGGAASPAALGNALQARAATRTSMDPFCHIFWPPLHREDPITCFLLHRKSTSCIHPWESWPKLGGNVCFKLESRITPVSDCVQVWTCGYQGPITYNHANKRKFYDLSGVDCEVVRRKLACCPKFKEDILNTSVSISQTILTPTTGLIWDQKGLFSPLCTADHICSHFQEHAKNFEMIFKNKIPTIHVYFFI